MYFLLLSACSGLSCSGRINGDGAEEDRIMNIVIAVALLIMLIVHIGKKNSDPRPAQKNHKHDDPDWIDELEVLDAVWDDSI